MATYYVSSVVAADNTGTGLDAWANAKASLSENTAAGADGAIATANAAGAGPHLILVDSAHAEALTADFVSTCTQDIRILSVDRDTDTPEAGAVVGSQATNYHVTLNGAVEVYVYGVTFKLGTGASSRNFTAANSDGSHFEFESCRFENAGTGGPAWIFGAPGASANSFASLKYCSWKANVAVTGFSFVGRGEVVGLTIDGAGTAPSEFIYAQTSNAGAIWTFSGCDLSRVSTTLVRAFGTTGHSTFTFSNCAIAATTILAAATTVLNRGNTEVWLFNCASGDNHFAFGHYDAFGSTVADATIYANDGAKYDSTNGVSWLITTTANCSYYTPYVSPWIDRYWSGTSAIAPYLEAVRSGSATAYNNDEVWAEVSVQATASSTKATIYSDRMALLGSPAAQTTGALSGAGWTGENATSAFMKLGIDANSSPTTVTPAEIGHLRMRVVVGKTEVTDLYVDPTIRT
jgi:hypothetical protein